MGHGGGVGKTTLLKKINQSLLDDANMGFLKKINQLFSGDANMGFHHVLFIEASKGIQLEELQKKIAQSLHLESTVGKEDIFNVLKNRSFVLLLDNIWEEVDLINLGIPHPYSNDNSTKQYKHKVIFTTRSEDVCAKMGAGENTIKVECLEPEEAWDLFKDNVNLAVIELDAKFKEIAWQVMEKCGGLPLALKVVGKAMSNKKYVQDWKFILNLINNSGTEVVQGVQESLLPILKFSYDTLPRNIQECFLYASIMRWSLSKDDALVCWMGLGLLDNFVNLQQAYLQARYIFNTLEESSLLYFSNEGDVLLHDVIYEMAMWIASDYGRNRDKWIVKVFYELAEIPTEELENWRFANRLIIHGHVQLLPILSHQCSDLFCLMIKRSSYLINIPEGFFQQMPNLKYLDLSRTRIKDLPKGIKYLVNLQYLNISSTNISSLPKELVYLKKLQYLICRNLVDFGKVGDGLMSRLQKLKVIDIYPMGWVEPEELKLLKKHNNIKAIGMRVVSQEVLQQLSCLPTTRLSLFNLDNLISLSSDTLSCKDHGFLRELTIRSCHDLKELVMNGSGSHLTELTILEARKLHNIIWTDLSPPEFLHVLKSLSVVGCNLDNLSWVLHLPCLSKLMISDCVEMKTLFYIEEREIQQQEVSEHPTFPALRSLRLSRLPELVSISNFALDFPQLTNLSVQNCAKIETLFHVEERERPIFPALEDLYINDLRRLVSISNFALDFPRLSWLRVLHVHQCFNLKKLPFKSGINNNQRMIDIHCEREWWERLDWDDDTIPSHLRQSF
ncbi:P-loop containing nucleoside triphosphate hydrolase protein [Dioscorea alata]|uniref:P-loop containing nucleoside triphosphate hydrolase protein n=1 Tax=Dioscorea alata TaxID=55571 RepID=A0ACB7UYQ4_DIOAL|nr:P-loop containing nucleoside triphosphate hydrolase protein [Dioscorea alata]